MSIDKDLLDRLMEGRSPGDLFGKEGILSELTKALAERALSTELDEHLCEQACNFGSDSVLVQLSAPLRSGRLNEPRFEQVDVRPSIHLAFECLEAVNLPFGLPIRELLSNLVFGRSSSGGLILC
nr:hypothetical protein [Leisingera thetidis]